MMVYRCIVILLVAVAIQGIFAHCSYGEEKTRDQLVREDRVRVEAEGRWIYNDFPRAFVTAMQTGKPILVVLRCIPCEECVKLDDELMEQDPVIRPLLEQFVCVRQVSTNGLDLSLFQFDTDQSFAVFMLNADQTIYGRFGTRSHRTEWTGDVSLPGLAEALRGALELHAQYPANKAALAGKRGKPLEVNRPEQYDTLKDRYTDTLDYEGNVAQSCIHCHQIGDARRAYYRRRKQPIPEKILFPTPHPSVIGLTLDPKHRAKVKSVSPDSTAAQAGFRPGDRIVRLDGQPLVSIADVQWVLNGVSANGGTVWADVQRGDDVIQLTLTMSDGWRREGDISWRVSTWGLRRMATGGLVLEALPPGDRARLSIADGSMALLVKRVGQYGPHAAAKRAGFQEGDVIVQLDGHRDLLSETDVLVHGVTRRRAGERVPVIVLRNGRQLQLSLPMQP